MRAALSIPVSLILCVAIIGCGGAAPAPDAAAPDIEHPSPSPSVATDSEAKANAVESSCEEFCTLYGSALRAESFEDRQSMAMRVYWSELTWDEKSWTIYCLLKPGDDADRLRRIMPWQDWSQQISGEPGHAWETWNYCDMAVQAECNQPHNVLRIIRFRPSKKIGTPVPPRGTLELWNEYVERMHLSKPESDPTADARAREACPEAFRTLCLRAKLAATAEERSAVAEAIRTSPLSDPEKGFLIYAMMWVGMSLDEAAGLCGGRQSEKKPYGTENYSSFNFGLRLYSDGVHPEIAGEIELALEKELPRNE